MSFFPLKYRATITRKVTTTDRSGQEIISNYATLEDNVRCLFLATSGNKNVVAKEQFSTAIAFYLEPGSALEEGDRIINIRTVGGVIIEPGPFEAVSVKRVPNHLTGKVHHISCKLQGAA
jgi:hypothetical protein